MTPVELFNGILADHAASQAAVAPRLARCMCGNTAPAHPDLPFFEYRGNGSRHATELCHCGYYLTAHDKAHVAAACAKTGRDPEARGPHQYDSFYCGCRGWD